MRTSGRARCCPPGLETYSIVSIIAAARRALGGEIGITGVPYIHCPGMPLDGLRRHRLPRREAVPALRKRHVGAAGLAVPLAATRRRPAARRGPGRETGRADPRAASVPRPDGALKRRPSASWRRPSCSNPVVRRLLDRGLMPRTHALLETTGRKQRAAPPRPGRQRTARRHLLDRDRARPRIGLRQEHRGEPARAREGRPRVARRHGARPSR